MAMPGQKLADPQPSEVPALKERPHQTALPGAHKRERWVTGPQQGEPLEGAFGSQRKIPWCQMDPVAKFRETTSIQ